MTDIEIEIYTDGSCLMSDPQRPGGWGYSIYMREGDKSTLIVDGSGSTSHTTNIKMELMAVMRKILHEFMKKYDVGYNWVRGHSSDAKNEKAHRLAKQEMQKEHGNNN